MQCTSCENCHILIITNSSIDPRYIPRLAGAADLHEEGVLPREPEVLAGGAGAQARPRQRHQDQEESQGDLRVSLLRPRRYAATTATRTSPDHILFCREFLSKGAKAEINIDGKTMEETRIAMKSPSR